jgi:hypothetical protein
MKYHVIPQNEGQSLNYIETKTNYREAVSRAIILAKDLQNALYEGTITCGVQNEKEGLQGIIGVIVFPDERIINGITGNEIM